MVIIAIEIFYPKGFGRIRMRKIEDASSSSLIPFICDSIEPGSIVHTDGWPGHNAITDHGYMHIKKISLIAEIQLM
ncbi:MAG: transposase [Desulfobacterales bacterium]|nr:transposase [Desulfobacterales bacterium]